MKLFLLRAVAHLPAPVLFFVARWLIYPLLYFVTRYRVKTVRKNLAMAFPVQTAAWRAQTEREFYRYLADVVVEILMLSRMTAEELNARVEIHGLEHLQNCKEQQLSAILLSAHQGNWEYMLTGVAMRSAMPLDALYRPLHDDDMDVFFRELRGRFNASMIPAEKAARVILKLRREQRCFGILGDQNPRRKDEKYWANLLGVETPVVIGPERIAKLTRYPLFYVWNERIGRGRYRITIEPLMTAPYEGDGEITQRYIDCVARGVQKQPAYWMWSHQRWRYQRKDCPESRESAR